MARSPIASATSRFLRRYITRWAASSIELIRYSVMPLRMWCLMPVAVRPTTGPFQFASVAVSSKSSFVYRCSATSDACCNASTSWAPIPSSFGRMWMSLSSQA